MARPERLLGATPLAPSGPPSLRDDVLRRLRQLVELPTAWFVVFQPKRPILLFCLLIITIFCPIEFACLACVPLFEVIWCNLLDS